MRDGQVVKGINFEGLRSAGDPAALARRYNREGIDEVVILDVTATIEKRKALARTIDAVARGDLPAAVRRRGHQRRSARRRGHRSRRGQGEPEHRRHRPARAAHGARAALREPGGHRRHRRQARGRRIPHLRAQRTAGHRSRRRGVGAGSGRPRRRGDPPHLDRPRRHQERIRLRADRGRVGGGPDTGDRVGRRRHVRPLRRRLHGRARRTPRWPRRSSTTRSTRWPTSSSTWPATACRSAAEPRRHPCWSHPSTSRADRWCSSSRASARPSPLTTSTDGCASSRGSRACS